MGPKSPDCHSRCGNGPFPRDNGGRLGWGYETRDRTGERTQKELHRCRTTSVATPALATNQRRQISQAKTGGKIYLGLVCLEKRVAVEIDGGQHSEAVSYDRQRDEWLRKQGFVVLRFWNDEVLTQIEGVKEVIWKALKEIPPWSSPARGGGKEIMLPATGAVIFDTWSLVTYESHLKSRRSRRHLGIRQ
jgi:very-short-patch-repair endonuclease